MFGCVPYMRDILRWLDDIYGIKSKEFLTRPRPPKQFNAVVRDLRRPYRPPRIIRFEGKVRKP